MKKSTLALTALAGCLLVALQNPAHSGAIYPIDRAAILAGSKFDFKVELDQMVDSRDVRISINGVDVSKALGAEPQFLPNEDGLKASSFVLRGVSLDQPGSYSVVATVGASRQEVRWEVYGTGKRKAKNVILFIGDGMTIANRTAARILSKGIKEGKYFGKLAFDDMPHMALVGTSGVDSIVTDSANSMSAYTTGHKSSVNALGVYVSRAKDNLAHPKVETLTEVVKRKTGMSVGIVSDAEIEDATPAGMVAHTRRRGDKDIIAEQLFFSRADVIMGGGSAYFLPQSTPGSKRKDGNNLINLFKADAYTFVSTDREMQAAAANPKTTKLLGLFHPDNMDGALDRHVLKKNTVTQFPEQPDLADMTRSAIQVLSRNPEGFVLMVEAGLIDKFNHPLDWERSVYDTIMLSNAVQVAKDFAARHGDTLILVTPDHTHGASIVGTIDDNAAGPDMRNKVGVYSDAGYPNYPAPNKDGYPEKVDVSKRLAFFYGNFPDHYETFHPKMDGTFVPAVKLSKDGAYVANPAYKDVPGAVLRVGNLPQTADSGTHTADDALLSAMGPGSEQVQGFIDNTDVFRIMVNSLGLADTRARTGKSPKPAKANKTSTTP